MMLIPWEYKIIYNKFSNLAGADEKAHLDGYGAAGWELVTIEHHTADLYYFVFKRPTITEIQDA